MHSSSYFVDNSLSIAGTWSQVHHGEYYLPDGSNKEATVDGVFYADEVTTGEKSFG